MQLKITTFQLLQTYDKSKFVPIDVDDLGELVPCTTYNYIFYDFLSFAFDSLLL